MTSFSAPRPPQASQIALCAFFTISMIVNIFSPATADIFIALTILLAFFSETTKSVLRTPKSLLFKTLTALIIIWIVANFMGYLLTPGFGKEQFEEFFGLRWILIFYGMILLGYNPLLSLRKLHFLVFLVAIATITSLYLQYFFIHPIETRFEGTLGNANVFAMTVLMLWAFSTGLAAQHGQKSARYLTLSAITVFVFTAAVYGTMTRSAWVGCLLCVIALPFIFRSRKIIYALIALALALSAMWHFDLFNFQSRILYSFKFSTGNSQSLRLMIWKANWEIFKDHPLFGVGFYENYRMMPTYYHRIGFVPGQVFTHAHNQFLQVMTGSGLIGFLSYLGILAIGLKYFGTKIRELHRQKVQTIALGAFLLILAYIGASFTESPLMLQPARSYLLIFLGISVGYLERTRLEKSSS